MIWSSWWKETKESDDHHDDGLLSDGSSSLESLLPEDSANKSNVSEVKRDHIVLLHDNEEETEPRKSRLMAGVLFLLFLFVTVIILYPREVDYRIASLEVDVNNATFTDKDGQLWTNWVALIELNNRNFVPISINALYLTAYLEEEHSAPVGNGQAMSLYFSPRKKQNGTINFQMPVYAPSSGRPSLIAACMFADKVTLLFDAIVDLSLLHWTGYTFNTSFSAIVDCQIPIPS